MIGDNKTTMIILCDDGSLKIYVADANKTEYWLQTATTGVVSNNSTLVDMLSTRLCRQNKHANGGNAGSHVSALESSADRQTGRTTVAKPLFPIDYFERCTQLNDIDITGNNGLLEVYNSQQIKHRLLNNKYILCTKPNGFKLEISNKEANFVLTGCRILCGGTSLDKIPQCFQVNDRIISTDGQQRQRWYDICLTRHESYMCNNKMTVLVDKSLDPNHHTIIDAIKVYGLNRTTDAFNWSNQEYELCKMEQHQQAAATTTSKLILLMYKPNCHQL
jgi:E3 ubiquitin-protein ligase UBR4